MRLPRAALVLILLCSMAACHSLPSKRQPPPAPANIAAPIESTESPVGSDSAPSAEDMKVEPAEIPPCMPVDSSPKPALKRKSKPLVRHETPLPAPVPPPPVAAEAGVKMLPTSSSSILGRKVSGQEGDDLGRLVDVLADAQGRVRIAIIEFGGFLGVGNRRIAVDWSLLKFHPDDPEAPVVLDVAKSKLQGIPEYKGAPRPQVLMGTETTDAPRPTTPN